MENIPGNSPNTTKNQVDVRKLGGVFWCKDASGEMRPIGLERLTDQDLQNMNKVYDALTTYRGATPVFYVIRNLHWDDMPRIKRYLQNSLSPRVESRTLIANDDWDTFWNSLN